MRRPITDNRDLKVRRRGRGEYDAYIGESLGRRSDLFAGAKSCKTMLSFKDVESYDDGIIDDDEFVLLFDNNTSKNQSFPIQNMIVLVWRRDGQHAEFVI